MGVVYLLTCCCHVILWVIQVMHHNFYKSGFHLRSINCCDINPVHQLLAVGTSQGHVECWDPRSKTRVGQVDIATANLGIERFGKNLDLVLTMLCTYCIHIFIAVFSGSSMIPEVTAMKYCNGLSLGVGTSTGHVRYSK